MKKALNTQHPVLLLIVVLFSSVAGTVATALLARIWWPTHGEAPWWAYALIPLSTGLVIFVVMFILMMAIPALRREAMEE